MEAPHPLVGRDDLLQILREELSAARARHGRVVFLSGEAGSGRTALVRRFQDDVRRRWRLRTAYVDAAIVGGAWPMIARKLTLDRRIARSLSRTTGEWLEVIPVLGDLLHALWETAHALRRRGAGAATLARGSAAARAAAEAGRRERSGARSLLEFGPCQHRLVIIDDADRGPPQDLAGCFTLVRRLSETRTLLVLTARSDAGRLSDGMRDLVAEAERSGDSSHLKLAPLGQAQVRDALLAATGAAPDAWVAWLARRSGGRPTDLWRLVDAAQEEGLLVREGGRCRWADAPPQRLGATAHSLTPAVANLDAADRALLASAAAEGDVFHSTALAAALHLDELDVEDRLARIARAGAVEFLGEAELASGLASLYQFRDFRDAETLRAGDAPSGVD